MRYICFDRSAEECDVYRNEFIRYNVSFAKLCNGINDQLPDLNNDTDETDCNMTEWSCRATSLVCNYVWNCPDGSDEMNCTTSTENIYFNYCNSSKHHFCLDIRNGDRFCLPIERAGNGIVDCLGSSDERTFCRSKYPYDYAHRYRCKNSNICISPVQVCDCHQDCPENDDEILACIWLNNGQQLSICNQQQFRCRNGRYVNGQENRCDDIADCDDGEDELFCNLIDRALDRQLVIKDIKEYPVVARNLLSNPDFITWYCNHGLYVRSAIDPPGFYCLCPNEYYGDRCQFQRKRLTVILLIRTASLLDMQSSIFKIVVMLIRNTTPITIVSHEQIVYTPLQYCQPTYMITLLYPINESLRSFINHTVHVHAFDAQTLKHRISRQFPISFEFLPVNRIVKELIVSDADSVPDVNQFLLNNTNCISCSNVSLCLGYDIDLHRDICVCPLNRTGRRCLIPFNPCVKDTCSGNGECIPYDLRHSKVPKYICMCYAEWYGKSCEVRKARIHISFSKEMKFSRLTIGLVHLLDTRYRSKPLQLIYLNRFDEEQSNFTIFINNRDSIPNLGFIQLYEHTDKFDYYLLISQNRLTTSEINTEIRLSHRCSPIGELFNTTILNQPRLRLVKNYHRPCLDRQYSSNQLRCFYDDKMMCLCDITNHAICFNFETKYQGCLLNKCNGRGMCIQNHEICPTNSTCICEKCSFGTACEFSTTGYSLSLDAILGSHIRVNTLNLAKHSIVIQISYPIIVILFIIGIILNALSIVTFSQKETHTTGSSFYLFISSIIGIMSMIILMCKMIILLIGKQTNVSCLLIEFILKLCPTCCEWLCSCVAVERIVAIKRATKFSNKLSRRVAKYVVPGVVSFIAVLCTFELIFRRVVIDAYDKKVWCVLTLNRDRPTLVILYSISNVFLYLVPLVINFTSCFIIIHGTFRSKQRATKGAPDPTHKKGNKKDQSWVGVREQIKKHKHILISATLLGIFTVPRLIITFIYVCTKLDRQPFLILIAYLIGFLPSISVLFAFILPSQSYRKGFDKTVKIIVPERIRQTVAKFQHRS